MKSMSIETAHKLLKDYPNLMTVEDAGKALCCHPRTIRRLVESDMIECTRLGRKLVIPKDAICAYLCRPVDTNCYN